MIGKYGMMRRSYLEENRPAMYEQMIRQGTLKNHLLEIDALARSMVQEQIKKSTQYQKNHAPDTTVEVKPAETECPI